MITWDDLQRMAETKDYLVDIQNIKIDSTLPIKERLDSYLSQIKNPYHFKCGNTPVKISYSDNGKYLSQKLAEHFIHINN